MSRDPAGLLILDKPRGPTSHDMVVSVRRSLGVKVGHAGTLDPQATGVLLVCVGSATRMSRFLQGHDKVYEGTIRLGWATTTYDAEGERATEPVEPPALDADGVTAALRRFVGTIEQRPPAYSAKKVRGQPAYRRARRGEDVQPDPVEVTIHSADLVELDTPRIRLRLRCGPGTYVRSLAHDLGGELGCPAHLEALRRLRSGPFGIEEAIDGDRLEAFSGEELREAIVPPAMMLPEWPAAIVGEDAARRVSHGNVVEPAAALERRDGDGGRGWPTAASEEPWVRILDRRGALLALGEVLPGGILQPRVVLA